MKPVMNIDEVKFDDVEENGLYTSSRGQISDHIGAKKLGYDLTVLAPGKAQCPLPWPSREEGMFLILEGEGEGRASQSLESQADCEQAGGATGHHHRSADQQERTRRKHFLYHDKRWQTHGCQCHEQRGRRAYSDT
jgi:uncharacterized cupin superfamily protein